MLDIDNIDLAMGKMMEQGPVLVITFNSQQILCVRDRTGKVIEGSPDKVRSEMEVTEIILAKFLRLCQLPSHRRGFLSDLTGSFFKSTDLDYKFISCPVSTVQKYY